MTAELTRNYFGTLALLCLAFPLILWDAKTWLFDIFEGGLNWKIKSALEYIKILRFICRHGTGLMASLSLVILVMALYRKKWFSPEANDTFWTFSPLLLASLFRLVRIIADLATGFPKLVTLKDYTALRPYIWSTIVMCCVYFQPFMSWYVGMPSSFIGLAFQPFKVAFKRGTQMNTLGCFLTVLTLILPNFMGVCLLAHLRDWKPLTPHTLFLWFALLLLGLFTCELFFHLGTQPYRRDRPYIKGLLAILTPILFFVFCQWTGLIGKGMFCEDYGVLVFAWMQYVDNYGVFCKFYLVAGVLGYVAYVLPTDNSFAKLYRVFYDEEEAEAAKEEA